MLQQALSGYSTGASDDGRNTAIVANKRINESCPAAGRCKRRSVLSKEPVGVVIIRHFALSKSAKSPCNPPDYVPVPSSICNSPFRPANSGDESKRSGSHHLRNKGPHSCGSGSGYKYGRRFASR